MNVSARQHLFARLVHALAFMDDNYLSNPNISEVARQSFLSKFHFNRCFGAAFGISPYQYLLNKRLNHAFMLITEDHKDTLTDVATTCGFADIYTFSKAFKKKYGSSPSAFRRSRLKVA